jgi:hypothetical protein
VDGRGPAEPARSGPKGCSMFGTMRRDKRSLGNALGVSVLSCSTLLLSHALHHTCHSHLSPLLFILLFFRLPRQLKSTVTILGAHNATLASAHTLSDTLGTGLAVLESAFAWHSIPLLYLLLLTTTSIPYDKRISPKNNAAQSALSPFATPHNKGILYRFVSRHGAFTHDDHDATSRRHDLRCLYIGRRNWVTRVSGRGLRVC